jgi:membrane-bound lytic murein transglycosylase D
MLVIAFAFGILVSPRGARADEFPTPPALAGAVRFWVDVFTRYGSDQVIVHDRFAPAVVLAVLRAPDGPDGAMRLAAEHEALADRLTLMQLFTPDAAGAPPPAVGAATDRLHLQRGLREAFADALAAHDLYRPLVERALDAEGLPRALAALPLIESSYHPGAVSGAGAVGLWQLGRDTARTYLRVDGELDERSDPALASWAAARHLHALHDALGTWPLALTAYHRGLAGVERARRTLGTDDVGVLVTHYRDDEAFGFASRNYYAQFLAALHVMKHRDRYFHEATPRRMVEYRVRRGDTLDKVARLHGVSLGALYVTNGLRSAALQPGQRILIRL